MATNSQEPCGRGPSRLHPIEKINRDLVVIQDVIQKPSSFQDAGTFGYLPELIKKLIAQEQCLGDIHGLQCVEGLGGPPAQRVRKLNLLNNLRQFQTAAETGQRLEGQLT